METGEVAERWVHICLEPGCNWIWHSVSSLKLYRWQRYHTEKKGHFAFVTMQVSYAWPHSSKCNCTEIAAKKVMDSGITPASD